MLLDMTIPLSDGMKLSETFPPVSLKDFFSHETTRDRYLPPCRGCKVETFSLATHTGTHADAPLHFVEGAQGMDTISPEKYMGDAYFVDVSDRPEESLIDGELLKKALENAGIRDGEGKILLLRFTKKSYTDKGFSQVRGLSEDAAQLIVDMHFKCVGIDSFCVDFLPDMRRPAHMCLLGNGVVIVEGLINMDKITKREVWFCALPLKLSGAGGAPVRAVCMI